MMRKTCLRRVLGSSPFTSGVYLEDPFYRCSFVIWQQLPGKTEVAVAFDDARKLVALAFVAAGSTWVLHSSDTTTYERVGNEQALLEWLQLP
jgi:hypothetical protein